MRAVGRPRWLSKIGSPSWTCHSRSQAKSAGCGPQRFRSGGCWPPSCPGCPMHYASPQRRPRTSQTPLRAATARPARNRLRTWEKMAGPATDFRCGPLVPLGRFALSPSLNVDQAFCGIEGKATRPTSRVLPEPSSHSSCLEPSTNYTFLAALSLSLLPLPPSDLPCVPVLWLIPAIVPPFILFGTPFTTPARWRRPCAAFLHLTLNPLPFLLSLILTTRRLPAPRPQHTRRVDTVLGTSRALVHHPPTASLYGFEASHMSIA